MWDQWLNRNVDLKRLVERVEPFFQEIDFETKVEKIRNGYMIKAISKIPTLNLRINVRIVGRPNDFKVEFSAGSKEGYFSPSMIIGYLTMMFGGGYVVSREASKRETLDMLEDDFWKHTQMQVADLGDSAAHEKSRSKTGPS